MYGILDEFIVSNYFLVTSKLVISEVTVNRRPTKEDQYLQVKFYQSEVVVSPYMLTAKAGKKI